MKHLVVVMLLLVACGDGRPSVATSAKRIEGRLYAPCCRNLIFAGHTSPTADALRAEIVTRLEKGESETSIEDDIVSRYGEEIRAAPSGFDSNNVAWGLGAFAVLGGLGVFWWARRRKTLAATPAATGPAFSDELKDRLDDELRDLD